MQAFAFESFGAPLRPVTLPDPVPPRDGVVIRVHAAGVCRSDWHAWLGHDPDIGSLPHVPGHEFAGEVAAVGADVRRVRPGQRVTVPFACGCGHAACPECSTGHAQVCPHQYQPGFSGPGAFAEYVAIPAADFNVVALPDEVTMDSAAALGCRFATAFRALAHPDQAAVRPGESVAVFGCGGVGLSAVLIAASMDARVLAVDPRPDARRRAVDMGAESACHPDEAMDFIRFQTGGRGVDVTVEAIGRADAAALALRCLRPRGRMAQIGLLLGDHADPPLPIGLVIARELRLIGSHGMAAASYPEMMNAIAAGRLQPDKLVGARIGFHEIGRSLEAMTRNELPAGAVIARWTDRQGTGTRRNDG